ncbi:MAG: dihydrodipicolinate synthase family protein [Lentisphaerae bacterium]|nr:dihydrodipicolinate synthase family protein [Lentisphaerota bacterium]
MNLAQGVWPVMLTPFDQKGVIDWSAYDALIDFYLEHGAAGLFAVCGSSEAAHLSPAEMLALTHRAVDHAAGRVPVVAGALLPTSVPELAGFIRQVHDAGTEAVVLSPSLLVAPEEDESRLRDRLRTILAMTDNIPLGIYEWPRPYHRLLTPDMLEWIAHTGRFVFHKDTCCDLKMITAKLQRLQGTPLKFYNANLPTLLDSLLLGADGYSGIGANFGPEAYGWICRYAGEREDLARRVQELLVSVESRLCRNYPIDPITEPELSEIRKAWAEYQAGFEDLVRN